MSACCLLFARASAPPLTRRLDADETDETMKGGKAGSAGNEEAFMKVEAYLQQLYCVQYCTNFRQVNHCLKEIKYFDRTSSQAFISQSRGLPLT